MIDLIEAWSNPPIRQQAVGELAWYHDMALLTELKQHQRRLDCAYPAYEHNPTVGLLLRKSENKIVVEFMLRDTNKPMGDAEHHLVESLPRELEASLPSIEQIDRELGEVAK